MEYPDFVSKKLEEISKRTETDIEEVKKEYEKFFNSDFIQGDEQFTNDEDRHQYAKNVFWTRYILRKPVKSFNLIPIGMDSIRKSKKTGMENTSMFCLDDKGDIRRVTLKGDICKAVKNLSLWSMYKDIKLGEFKDSKDLIADDRADFNNPEKLSVSPEDLLSNQEFPEVKIIDAGKQLSKVGSDGYVVKTDWKCIRGIVLRYNKSGEDADSEWGVYTIVDESVDPDKMEPEVSPSGEILPPGFSVWTSPNLMNYGVESECRFIGTIQKSQDGKVSMNAYSVIPIHAHYED